MTGQNHPISALGRSALPGIHMHTLFILVHQLLTTTIILIIQVGFYPFSAVACTFLAEFWRRQWYLFMFPFPGLFIMLDGVSTPGSTPTQWTDCPDPHGNNIHLMGMSREERLPNPYKPTRCLYGCVSIPLYPILCIWYIISLICQTWHLSSMIYFFVRMDGCGQSTRINHTNPRCRVIVVYCIHTKYIHAYL